MITTFKTIMDTHDAFTWSIHMNFQAANLLKYHAQHSTSTVQREKNMLSSITFNKLYQKIKCQVTPFHETLNLVFLIPTMKLEIQTLNNSMNFSY